MPDAQAVDIGELPWIEIDTPDDLGAREASSEEVGSIVLRSC